MSKDDYQTTRVTIVARQDDPAVRRRKYGPAYRTSNIDSAMRAVGPQETFWPQAIAEPR